MGSCLVPLRLCVYNHDGFDSTYWESCRNVAFLKWPGPVSIVPSTQQTHDCFRATRDHSKRVWLCETARTACLEVSLSASQNSAFLQKSKPRVAVIIIEVPYGAMLSHPHLYHWFGYYQEAPLEHVNFRVNPSFWSPAAGLLRTRLWMGSGGSAGCVYWCSLLFSSHGRVFQATAMWRQSPSQLRRHSCCIKLSICWNLVGGSSHES